LEWGMLSIALAYFFATSVGLGVYIQRKYIRYGADFTIAGRRLPWWLAMAGLTLTPFGVGNSLALSESSWIWGASVLWWMIVGSGLLIAFLMIGPGKWFRRLGVPTFAHGMEVMFDERYRVLAAIQSLVCWLGIASLEMYGCSGALFGFTGLPWEYCMAFACVLYIIYVLFSGTMQMAVLNFMNIFVIYGLLAASFIGLTGFLGPVGGWVGAEQLIVKRLGAWATTLVPPDKFGAILLGLILPILICHTAACSTNQGFLQPLLGARSEKAVRQGWAVGMTINVFWGYMWTLFGLLAIALPATLYGALAPVIESLRAMPGVTGAVPATIITIMQLPFVSALGALLALMAATISTGGAFILGNATTIAEDLVKRYIKPDISEKSFLILERILVVVFALLALGAALMKPYILGSFLWVWIFAIPTFVCMMAGFLWLRNAKAAWWTTIIGWVVNVLWLLFSPVVTATLPWWMHPPYGGMYPVTILSVILYVALTMAWRGQSKPGLLRIPSQEVK